MRKQLTRSNLTVTIMRMLKFSLGNAKLRKGEAIFDLPAGHSCPFAKLCRSSANKITGRIKDGPDTEFRCYAASSEIWSNVRKARWHNFELMLKCKTTGAMSSLIANCLPESTRIRIHSSGDFFSQGYFDAWLAVARQFPHRIFYCYTKALPFWIKRLSDIPPNFKLTASYGGTHDALIAKHGLKSCRVVGSPEEAESLNLEIDHDDSHAWKDTGDFALLIHGTQPAGSAMSKAWEAVKLTHGGYSY